MLVEPILRFRTAQKALVKGEFQLREDLRHWLEPEGVCESAPPIDPRQLFEGVANALELHLAIGTLVESLTSLGVITFGDLMKRHAEVRSMACRLARMDVDSVIRRNAESLPQAEARDDTEPINLTIDPFVKQGRSLLVNIDLPPLESLAASMGLGTVAHRCRLAHDTLVSFVRRNSAERSAIEHVTGHAYAEGRISLSEAATLLSQTPTDTIAYLEAHGFCRPMNVIELSPDDRGRLLTRIRQDRLARAGQPVISEALVDRDVIASCRIEGVDARAWMPTR